VDKDGGIYLIETKLFKNPDKRTVVAQVLDYGASLWRSNRDFAGFVGQIEELLEGNHRASLDQRLREFYGLESEGISQFRENLKSNLSGANFKFVVLMNRLDERLKDLILFVNQNSNFALFAVELEYYKHESFEIMIPRLFGAETAKKSLGASGARGKWDESKFFEACRTQLMTDHLEAIRRIYESSRRAAEISWGTGATTGSFNVIVPSICGKSLFTVTTFGELRFNFGWLTQDRAPRYRDELKQRLEKVGFAIPRDYQKRWVGFPPEGWVKLTDRFLETLNSFIEASQK
jgi:hypothetical protein